MAGAKSFTVPPINSLTNLTDHTIIGGMKPLRISNQFKKDLRACIKRGFRMRKLASLVDELRDGQQLSPNTRRPPLLRRPPTQRGPS